MESNRGPDLCLSQVLSDSLEDVIKVLLTVLIFGFVHFKMDFVVFLGIVVGEIVFLWDLIVDLSSQHQAGFVGPTSSHVLDCVAPSSQQNHRSTKLLHIGYALAMALD